MMPAEREAAIRSAVDQLVSVLLAAVTPEPADAPDRLLSIPAAADLMSIGRTRLYAELDAGRLRVVRAGRRVLIPASAIGEWIAAQSSGATGTAPVGRRSRPGAAS